MNSVIALLEDQLGALKTTLDIEQNEGREHDLLYQTKNKEYKEVKRALHIILIKRQMAQALAHKESNYMSMQAFEPSADEYHQHYYGYLKAKQALEHLSEDLIAI